MVKKVLQTFNFITFNRLLDLQMEFTKQRFSFSLNILAILSLNSNDSSFRIMHIYTCGCTVKLIPNFNFILIC